MRRTLLLVGAVIVGVVLVSAASGSAGSGQARWVTTDLGPLGGEQVSVNELGQVGFTAEVGNYRSHASLWDSGKLRDLGTLGGKFSFFDAVNDRGQVVGTAETRGGDDHAFLWENGRMRDLGTLPGGTWSRPSAINERGQIVGSAGGHAFLWANGKMRDLGTLGGSGSTAEAINDGGQVVGSRRTKGGDTHAIRWERDRMHDLGPGSAWALNEHGLVIGKSGLGVGVYWQNGKGFVLRVDGLTKPWKVRTPVAVNGRGQIVGNYERPRSEDGWLSWLRACLWDTRTGAVRDLGTLGGTTARAYALSASGQVVGASRTANNVLHAFLWQSGRITDLQPLPGDTESAALDINNHNQIVGWSRAKTGPRHAVLWTLRSG